MTFRAILQRLRRDRGLRSEAALKKTQAALGDDGMTVAELLRIAKDAGYFERMPEFKAGGLVPPPEESESPNVRVRIGDDIEWLSECVEFTHRPTIGQRGYASRKWRELRRRLLNRGDKS